MIKLGIPAELMFQIDKGEADPEAIRSALFDQNRKALAYLQNLADADTLNVEELQRMTREVDENLQGFIQALHEALHRNRKKVPVDEAR